MSWLAAASALLSVVLAGLFLLRAALHRTPDASGTLTGLLVVCALIFWLPRSLLAGLRGNEAAFRSGRYLNPETLLKAQRSWTPWAIITVLLMALLLGISAAILNAT